VDSEIHELKEVIGRRGTRRARCSGALDSYVTKGIGRHTEAIEAAVPGAKRHSSSQGHHDRLARRPRNGTLVEDPERE